MKSVVTVQEDIAGILFSYLLITAANHLFMDMCDQAPLRLPKMQDHQLLTLDWRSFSGWCTERLCTCLLYKGCQYIRKWQCSTRVNNFQLTVGYLNVTVNGKTQDAEPEIGPEGFRLTRPNQLVDGNGSEFGPPRCSGSGFRTVPGPNSTVFVVHTRPPGGLPGSVADTTPDACLEDQAFGIHHAIIDHCWQATMWCDAFWLPKSVVTDANNVQMPTLHVWVWAENASVGVILWAAETIGIWHNKGGVTTGWIDATAREHIWETTKSMSIVNQWGISKKYFRPGVIAPSEWTCNVGAVRDTPVADHSAPGPNTVLRVAYRPPIAVILSNGSG